MASGRLKVLFHHFPSSLNWFLIDQMKIMPDPNSWFWLVDNQNFKLALKTLSLVISGWRKICQKESHAKPNLNRHWFLVLQLWWHKFCDKICWRHFCNRFHCNHHWKFIILLICHQHWLIVMYISVPPKTFCHQHNSSNFSSSFMVFQT